MVGRDSVARAGYREGFDSCEDRRRRPWSDWFIDDWSMEWGEEVARFLREAGLTVDHFF